MPHAWPVTDLSAALAPLLPGLGVEVVAEIDSTNTELMRRARAGDTAPVLLVAERQTAGRGRLGRSWSIQGVEPGTQAVSLMFSLGLPFAPRDWSGLSLAVGVSVADGIDPGGAAGVRLKWPNDLWMADDRKLAGILIETASAVAGNGTGAGAPRQLVIGIGINIGPRDAQGLRAPPAWVREWRPDASAADVLRDIAVALVRDVQSFGARGLAPFAERFAARDALRGREVDLSDGTTGQCEGIGWDGELRVRTADGLRSIVSSDISVRPRRAGD
ncbi:MAG TPA: biotin--[acetyl-CoA-carboxylase] ligase [Variovorax sp.]|jgi:BirA family biotin operon repressor/biotin-[acetyl-CoA-carboxylase] ligase|nr:biotin--[acetyl-CoA-carboxylase] ligase [Variovorax sp.]